MDRNGRYVCRGNSLQNRKASHFALPMYRLADIHIDSLTDAPLQLDSLGKSRLHASGKFVIQSLVSLNHQGHGQTDRTDDGHQQHKYDYQKPSLVFHPTFPFNNSRKVKH